MTGYKLTTLRNNANPFFDPSISSERRKFYQERSKSKEEALQRFSEAFGERIGARIVFNIMMPTIEAQQAKTFQEAWELLDYTQILEVLNNALSEFLTDRPNF